MDYQKKLDELKARISTLKTHYKFHADEFIKNLNMIANQIQGFINLGEEKYPPGMRDELITSSLNRLENTIASEEHYGAS